MTEQEKFAGKFLERQRQQKLQAKEARKLEKAAKTEADADEHEQDKKSKKADKDESSERKENDEREEISEKDAIKLRKFLKDGCEFKGLTETAVAVLKSEDSRQLKVKVLTKKISQIFRLSEDYESDESDIDDDVKWLTNKKKISKKLKRIDSEQLVIEGKLIKYFRVA